MSKRALVDRVGCFAGSRMAVPPTPRGRAARALAGIGFFGVAAALVTRLDGATAMAGGALALWFGLSHLVAAATAYPGCPELGAVPSLVRGRPLGTNCEAWRRIDRVLGD
jgi:hypothetical protein